VTSVRLSGDAPAKLNLALVVGPVREGGKHEVVTVLQALELSDEVEVRVADAVEVDGFGADTLVRAALLALEAATGVALAATITKRVPVAAGLGGGSSDAATALRLGNELLEGQVEPDELSAVAARLGADVPFFLGGPQQLGAGDGSELSTLTLPTEYAVLLALPFADRKESTASIYRRFDERVGAVGFSERRQALLEVLRGINEPRDLALLPRNDLATSPLSAELEQLGAFRADVTGAGPTVYALFADEPSARRAAEALADRAKTWITRPRAPRDERR
jgi:4-diphosphocytidyl-2-C-methyl-D-erythritol kinase